MILATLLLLQYPDELVRRFGDDDPAVRQAAAAALIEIGEPARDALVRAAENPDAEVAHLAGLAVRELDRRQAVADLCRGLDPLVEEFYPPFKRHVFSEDPEIRRATLAGILGPHFTCDPYPTPRESVVRILDAMIRFHPPDDSGLLEMMLDVYKSIQIEPSGALLDAVLAGSSPSLIYRVLDKELPAEIVPRVRMLARSENADIRGWVVDALAQLDDEEDVAIFLRLARDADPGVASHAFSKLPERRRPKDLVEAFLQSSRPRDRVEAVQSVDSDGPGRDVLKHMAQDPDSWVRGSAMAGLASAGNPDRVADLAALLEFDRSRNEAAKFLAGIPGAESKDRLLELLRTTPDFQPSVAVAEALRRDAPDVVFDWLDRHLRGGDGLAVAAVLHRLHDSRATEFLSQFVRGSAPGDERAQALKLLSTIPATGTSIVSVLDDPEVGSTAVMWMSTWASPEQTAELWSAMLDGKMPWSMELGRLFPGPVLDGLVLEALQGNDPETLAWTLRYVDELGLKPDERRVLDLASSDDPKVRDAALSILGRYESDASRTRLRAALRDPATIHRALDAVQFPLDEADVRECERIFGADAWDYSRNARHEALRPHIERLFESQDEDERRAAIWAFERNHVAGYAAQAEALLTARDPFVRTDAAQYLVEFGRPESVPTLIGRLDDPFSLVRGEARRAIARLKPPEAVEPLSRLAMTRPGEERQYLFCLASIDAGAALSTAEALLDSRDEYLDYEMLNLIQAHDPERYASTLYRLADREDGSVYVLNRMAKISDSRCADQILAVLRDGSERDAGVAAMAAASLGIRDAAPLLVERIRRGEHELVRRLGALGPSDHIEFVREHLDPAAPGLADAIGALVELGDPDLEGDLDRYVNHSRDEVRLAVLRAIDRLGVTRLAPALRIWTRDECQDLRMGAAAALVRMGDPEAAACARRIGASPYHRKKLFQALNRPVLPDAILKSADPEGPATIRASDLIDIVSTSRLGYVIDGDAVRIMPWERAVEEIVARR